jgi:hypothetical protein
MPSSKVKLSPPGLTRWPRLGAHCHPKRDCRVKPGNDSRSVDVLSASHALWDMGPCFRGDDTESVRY